MREFELNFGEWYNISHIDDDSVLYDWYGTWEFLHVSNGDLWFRDKSGAKLLIPKKPEALEPVDNWKIEEV